MSDPTPATEPNIEPSTAARAEVLFREHSSQIVRRTDRLFAGLLVVEWLAGIVVAFAVAPFTWIGTTSSLHPHLVAAVVLGALVTLPAAAQGWFLPGKVLTRHSIAVAQMLIGALLIHLSGGRIETHFIIFGSLAFLAFYRDWRVIITATVIVAGDHILRGAMWPQSVYGVLTPSAWRWIEHAGWVVFEDVFLIASCAQGQREMRQIADRHARLEEQNRQVQAMAAELVESSKSEQGRMVAEQSSRSKSEFLANMSHEIRTPMTAIQGYADLLIDPELSVSDRLNYVQTIRRNSDHLLSIINDILDISKIEAGKMTVEQVPCSPCQIMVDVASLMRVRAVEKGVAFDVVYQGAIPESIKSDPTRLRQIVMNLVGNAIKFTESGSVKLIVRCEHAESPDPKLIVEIADTGLGLTREQIGRLFQSFSQADSSTTRRFGGTGLGLVICQRLAGMLGGDITVESLVGRGSSFTLTLKTGSLAGVKMLDDLREAGVPLSLAPALGTAITLTGRILLAEDGIDNQLLITTHLRKAGANVVVAENGRIALESALEAMGRGEPFDLILMDMQMPELDGYGATAKLRGRGYTWPIIALTAHAMTGDRERCIAAGCDDYLTKPINRATLLSTAQQYMALGKPPVAAPVAAVGAAPVAAVATASPTLLVSELAGDPDMAEIIARFITGVPARMDELRHCQAAADRESMKRIAHQLKGAAGGYGFPSITTAAAELELALRQGDSASTSRCLEELLALCGRVGHASAAAEPARRSA